MKLQSRMKPTYIAIPASTAIGIGSVKPPATNTTSARTNARITPESGERAPTWNIHDRTHRSACTAKRRTSQKSYWRCPVREVPCQSHALYGLMSPLSPR